MHYNVSFCVVIVTYSFRYDLITHSPLHASPVITCCCRCRSYLQYPLVTSLHYPSYRSSSSYLILSSFTLNTSCSPAHLVLTIPASLPLPLIVVASPPTYPSPFDTTNINIHAMFLHYVFCELGFLRSHSPPWCCVCLVVSYLRLRMSDALKDIHGALSNFGGCSGRTSIYVRIAQRPLGIGFISSRRTRQCG